MSTRCNVIIKDSDFGTTRELIFYRHCDGYPEGVAKTLGTFLKYVKSGRFRDNVGQSAGWLIVLGHQEDGAESNSDFFDWKVGSYEPSTCIHGDIEYLYEIDLTKKTIEGWNHNGESKGKSVTKKLNDLIKKVVPQC